MRSLDRPPCLWSPQEFFSLPTHWQRLPERVASHFNGAGSVDGWMGKDANFLLSAGLIIGLTASFYLVGVMMRRLPQRWINLPNKAYWFAEERENATRAQPRRLVLDLWRLPQPVSDLRLPHGLPGQHLRPGGARTTPS